MAPHPPYLKMLIRSRSKPFILVFRIEARTHPDPFVRRDLPVTEHSDSPLLIQHHLPASVFSIRKMQKAFPPIDNGLIEWQTAPKQDL